MHWLLRVLFRRRERYEPDLVPFLEQMEDQERARRFQPLIDVIPSSKITEWAPCGPDCACEE